LILDFPLSINKYIPIISFFSSGRSKILDILTEELLASPVATSFIGVFFGGLKEMRAQINTELDYNYQADVN
jgi:hypothetical protein